MLDCRHRSSDDIHPTFASRKRVGTNRPTLAARTLNEITRPPVAKQLRVRVYFV